jgi:hypothetical protein
VLVRAVGLVISVESALPVGTGAARAGALQLLDTTSRLGGGIAGRPDAAPSGRRGRASRREERR